jgi:NADPH:quinone reductase-like Zn-dependent oxidoreductase
VGLLTGKMADRDEAQKQGRGVRVDSIYVGSARHFERMNEAIARWGLHPIVDRTFPFEAAARAYRHLESGAHFGKIVITL